MKSDFSPSRRAWNVIMTALVWAAAVLVIALTVGVIGLVLVRGIPRISWEFLSTTASVLKGTDGILPAILNTLYVILLTLLIVLPLGVGAAEDAVPGAREEILTGRIKATDAEITALAKTPKAEIPAALAELRKPKQERQPRKAETTSSKQTLSEISKSIQGHQRQLTTEERTFLKASIDNRYQERAVANGSLMMCEVQGAKEDFIRRWNSIFKEYPDVFEDSDCRKIIHDLTEDAVQYLLKIKEKTL